MPQLNTESFSTSTGARRGRPPRAAAAQLDSPAISAGDREPRDLRDDAQIAAEYAPDRDVQVGQQCPRCGEFSEKNEKILRAYGLVVDKCSPCHNVWIEGDVGYVYDITTAAAGALLRRATIVYEIKHPTVPVPSVKVDNWEAALSSEWNDPRWSELS